MTDLERSELTRWIAEKVMGASVWFVADEQDFYCYFRSQIVAFSPCKLIEHAWMGVDRMRELGWIFLLREGLECWEASFSRDADDVAEWGGSVSAPLAICLAMKAALEGGK